MKLLGKGADADAEDKPTIAQCIKRPKSLRDGQRMVVAEHEHRRRESDAFGARGEIAEGRQRIPVAAAPPFSLARWESDVLPARQMVVPEAVCRTRDSHDFVDPCRYLPVSMRPRQGPDHRRDN
jgi:hypothetical protein